jgi:hypothetical protein
MPIISISGSFLPSLGRQTTTVYSGRGSQHCYEIKSARTKNQQVTQNVTNRYRMLQVQRRLALNRGHERLVALSRARWWAQV